MKKITALKRALSTTLLLFFTTITSLSLAQPCTTGTIDGGAFSAPTNSTSLTIDASTSCNKYYMMNNLVAGQQYEVWNTVGYGIAIVDLSGNLVYSSTSSYIAFMTPVGVTSVKIVIYGGNNCVCPSWTNGLHGPVRVKCTYCDDPPPIGDNNSACRAAVNSNITLAVTNAAWMGQEYFNGVPYNSYARLTGAVKDKSYTIFQTNCGSNSSIFVVVTIGSGPNGTTVISGYLPLTFIAPATADNGSNKYYAHFFTDDACGGVNTVTACGRFSFGLTAPLSVELISFTGKASEQGNELSWSTASEKNNDYFLVEASSDGYTFNSVGRVNGVGNSTTTQEYSLVDVSPTSNQMYYRLTQVDFDGTISSPSLIVISRKGSNQLIVFPNPFSNDLNVNVKVETSGNYQFNFISTLGTVVEQNRLLKKGFNSIHLDTKGLSSGFYILTVIDEVGNTIYTTKVIKE